jgi:transposase InsO family protein
VKRLRELVEVSRSGFYAWRDRPPSQHAVSDAELLDEVRVIHERSRGTYRAPRIEGQLRRLGPCHGRKRVARLMRTHGLVGAHARRPWRPDTAPAPDRLERDFTASAPDQRWVSDITEFATGDGKLYLAAIVDVAWRIQRFTDSIEISKSAATSARVRSPSERPRPHRA